MDDGLDLRGTRRDLLSGIPDSYYGFIFHYYRAEVYRETNWRNRLDTTTNWAIVVTAGIVSFTFSYSHISHAALLLNNLVVWFFLYIESRRYRYYSLLRYRTRVMEQHILGPIISGKKPLTRNTNWLVKLAQTLQVPKVTMSRMEALAWRLRRNYVMIFPLLFLVWLGKISLHPVRALSLSDMLQNARLLFIPGELVFAAFWLNVVSAVIFAYYYTIKSHHDDLP